MSFKVTIEETRDVRKVVGKQWVKVGEKMNEPDSRWDHDGKPWKSDEMGYSPEVKTVRSETVKVYEQIVDALDLKSVIEAVNK